MPRFEENIAAVAEAVGFDKPGLVFGLAMADWPTEDERNDFLRLLNKEG